MDGGGIVFHVGLRAEPTATSERVLEQAANVRLRGLIVELVGIDRERAAVVRLDGRRTAGYPTKDPSKTQLG